MKLRKIEVMDKFMGWPDTNIAIKIIEKQTKPVIFNVLYLNVSILRIYDNHNFK